MSGRHLLFLLAGAVLVHVDAASARPSPIDVVARIYNTARVPDDVRHAAVAVAKRALASSAINVSWQDCDTTNSCSGVPDTGELVIRLVRSSDTPGKAAALVLGDASIDRGLGAGVLATIYVNRVEVMAGVSETDVAVLLGRAIAHELGHLLLATNAHSPNGLMRAQWTPQEIRANQIVDWELTKGDVAAIRRRLR